MKAAKPSDSMTAPRDVNRIWRVRGHLERRAGKSSVRVEETVGSNITERLDHAEKSVKKKFQVAGKSGH